MSELYTKYFETGDVYDGLGKLLYARKESKISDKQMQIIANELADSGKIEKTSSYEVKPWWQWNEEYVSYLMNGLSTGRVSRDYLIYYSKVRSGTTIKRVLAFVAIIAIIIIVIAVASEIISSHNAR